MRAVIFLAMAVALAGCGSDEPSDTSASDTSASDTASTGLPDSTFDDADAILASLGDFRQWAQVTGREGIVGVAGGHGPFNQIWINEPAASTFTAAAGADLPNGSVLIKEVYDADTGDTITKSFMMAKQSDGVWLFAKWDAAGALVSSGQTASCMDCHSRGQDSVRVTTW